MSKPVDPNALDTIAQAFGSDCVVVPIASILPVRAIEKTAKSSHKHLNGLLWVQAFTEVACEFIADYVVPQMII
jgi:imidazole glycerol phosphate synthase subunit HisF